MRIRLLCLLVLSGAVAMSLATDATGQASRPLQAEIGPEGKLVEGGLAADVRITVLCGSGYRLLEAFAYITQDGNTSQFAGIPVVCDGHRRTYTVRVRAFEETPFRKGGARVSAFVLVEVPHHQTTNSVSPSRHVALK